MITHNVVGAGILHAVRNHPGMPKQLKVFAIPLEPGTSGDLVWFIEGEGAMRMSAEDPAETAKKYWERAMDCPPGEIICLPAHRLNCEGDLIQAIRMARPAGLPTQLERITKAMKSQ